MHATVILVCSLFVLASPAIYTGEQARLRGQQARANRQPIDDAILLVTEAVRNLEDPLLNCTTSKLEHDVEDYPGWKEALVRELAAHGYRVEIGDPFCSLCLGKGCPSCKRCEKIPIQLCWDKEESS